MKVSEKLDFTALIGTHLQISVSTKFGSVENSIFLCKVNPRCLTSSFFDASENLVPQNKAQMKVTVPQIEATLRSKCTQILKTLNQQCSHEIDIE